MIQKARLTFKQIQTKFQVQKPWDIAIISVLNLLIAIPVFIIAYQNIIDPDWYFKLDRILLFIAILIAIQLLLRAMRKITLISVFLYLGGLFYGTVFGGYGFYSVYEDYNSMVYSMTDNPYPQDIVIAKLLPFPNKSKIVDAIEYENPKVRNFAIMATSKHFQNVKRY